MDPDQDLSLRAVTMDDVGAIGALVRRAQVHDGVPQALSDEEVAEDLSAAFVDLDLDTRVAERGGEVVGWSQVWHLQGRDRLDRVDLFGEVDPGHRGTGVGRTLLGWAVDRAIERLRADDHDLPRFVRLDTFDWLEDRQRLFHRFGFEAVRWSEMLVRPLTDLPPLTAPAGISIRPWPEGEADGETLEVRNEAFGDHWGSTVIPAEVWAEVKDGYGARRDLSFVAVDEATGALAGISLNQAYPEDEAVTGRRDGIIATLGTRRAFRGRGVASALITHSLHAFAADGFTHGALDVDSDNPTGARRLYAALGFEPDHGAITFQLEVGPG